MAIVLLLTGILALAGFLLTSIQGFAVVSGLAAGQETARALVTRHVGWAIPTVLFSLFSQSMVIFYFIGTGKLVKEETGRYPERERRVILAALRRFKMKTSPPATFALLSAIAVFVLGGAAHTHALPSWTHLGSAVAAVLLHLWALLAQGRVFAENTDLMNDPGRYARSRLPPLSLSARDPTGRGGGVETR